MKSVKFFLNKHFIKSSQKLKTKRYIGEIISNFPQSITKDIEFFYIKNEMLFFIVRSSVCKQELIYKKKLFFSLLEMKKKYSQDPSLEDLKIKDIKIKLNYKNINHKSPQRSYKFTEKAVGNFQNTQKNPKIYAIFEEIKTLIRKNSCN